MWTDAAIETLRRMALEGKSASTIAAVLGASSRNAVIGKANRIGVKLTGNIHCLAPRAARPSVERVRRHWAISPASMRLPGAAAVPAVQRERKPTWAFAQAQVGEMLNIGLEEINENACRWPVGDPQRRRIRLLRHSVRQGPLLLRRTLPDGLQAAEFPGPGRPSASVALEFHRRLTLQRAA